VVSFFFFFLFFFFFFQFFNEQEADLRRDQSSIDIRDWKIDQMRAYTSLTTSSVFANGERKVYHFLTHLLFSFSSFYI